MGKASHPQMQQDATPRNNILPPKRAIERFLSRRNDLSERQRTAVDLLLQGLSDQEVAGRVSVDRTTIFRWRKSIAFARELDRQRRLIWEQSVAQLQSMVQPALSILQKQLTGDDPRNAMRAASVLLRFATPSRLLAPSSADDAQKQGRRLEDDMMDYIEAPLPGEPGAPEDFDDDEEDADLDD